MEKHIEQFFEDVYNKYRELNLPKRFSLAEIDKILREKYSAVEEDLATADIGDDVENPCKYYVIKDSTVLENLFTAEEKIDLYTMACFSEEDMIEDEADQMWADIQAGKRINVILTSEDNQYINGFTIQGESEKLLNELCIFEGIEKQECYPGNENFHEYLKRLIKADYIEMDK